MTFQSNNYIITTLQKEEEKPTKELSQEEKRVHNQIYSKRRIGIEHAICILKKFSRKLAAEMYLKTN
jgi:hypothetical protein